MNFLSIAKALLPKNSPLLSKVDQAQQLAGRFSQDKNGVLELMRQYNIGQERLQQAVAALNNPKISGFLNMVQPGLPDKLRNAAREIINNQNKNTAEILNGQKDLYIRDLERVATQQFITSQNEQTRNLITLTTANQEAKAAAEACAINNRLTQIEDKMLKAPTFTPFGGLPLIGCSNYGWNNGWNGGCCPTTV